MNDPEAFTLSEPVPAAPYLPAPGPPWWVWALAAFVVAGLAAALVMAIRRRKKRRASGPDPEKARRRAMAELSSLDPSASPSELAKQISLILRRFLSEAFEDPALFETHEEFISRRDALDRLPADQRDSLARLFDDLVRFKYSPASPGSDAAPLLDAAAALLAKLEIKPPPEPEKPKALSPPPLPPSRA